MRARLATVVVAMLLLFASPGAAWAQESQDSMTLVVTVYNSAQEYWMESPGMHIPLTLLALGSALILTSTVLKALYSRHYG